MLQLDEGEADVITIAKDKDISLVCIDEFAARQYASLLRPLCDKLIENKRYISSGLYNEVLRKAGEQ